MWIGAEDLSFMRLILSSDEFWRTMPSVRSIPIQNGKQDNSFASDEKLTIRARTLPQCRGDHPVDVQ